MQVTVSSIIDNKVVITNFNSDIRCCITDVTIASLIQKNLSRKPSIPYLLAVINFRGSDKDVFVDGASLAKRLNQVEYESLFFPAIVSKFSFHVIDENEIFLASNPMQPCPIRTEREWKNVAHKICTLAFLFQVPDQREIQKKQIDYLYYALYIKDVWNASRFIEIAYSFFGSYERDFLNGLMFAGLIDGITSKNELKGCHLIRQAMRTIAFQQTQKGSREVQDRLDVDYGHTVFALALFELNKECGTHFALEIKGSSFFLNSETKLFLSNYIGANDTILEAKERLTIHY